MDGRWSDTSLSFLIMVGYILIYYQEWVNICYLLPICLFGTFITGIFVRLVHVIVGIYLSLVRGRYIAQLIQSFLVPRLYREL